MPKRLLILTLVSVCYLARAEEPPRAAPQAVEEELPVSALVDELFKQIETGAVENIWEPVNRLVRQGRAQGAVVTERLERALSSVDPKVQLASARALCQLNSIEQAAPALCKLVQNSPTPEIRRMAAASIALTGALCGHELTTNALREALKNEKDALTQICIARSLWKVGPQPEGRDALLKILAQSPDKQIKDEAALALGENGALYLPQVRARLVSLYNEPTPQGERARLTWRDEAARETKVAKGEELIGEVVRTIKIAYPDPARTDSDKLFEDAAKGMVGALDPFSQYLDRDEVIATKQLLEQDYGGIGAYVGVRNSSFVITSPIYGSPADRAGLRAMDIIQEVDGAKTGDMLDKGGINGVIGKLKGAPGTQVKVKYFRRGFSKPIEVSIKRERIRVDTVHASMLPGDIGYIRLTRFGERSSDEMQAALNRLVGEQRARALILDLRDNPGGLLRAGVEVADKFLAGNKLLVYSEGNKDFPRKDYYSSGPDTDEALPLVALVGAGSASASEIVAGALQDHKRATLVGERTFGKGSVQQIIPLKATNRETQLRLTVAKYYLPSGRCIHEKGVDVDIEVKPPETHSWVIEALLDLRKDGVFEDHIRSTWDANRELYLKLAVNDEEKCENWPGFDAFYKGLKTRLDPGEIRADLRMTLRRRVQDELKRELVTDLEEDVVLQRGVLEVLNKLKADPQAIADYKKLPEKFKKPETGQAQEGAMLPKQGATTQ